jgi:uncharacterized membrane protein
MNEDQKETGRVEAFSDGVFAIAITLLILELKVPLFGVEHGDPSSADLWHRLAADWHHYLAFFLSFVSILVMWVNHHRIFSVIRKCDDGFLFWNGLLLMCITVVPYPTALIAEYMDKSAANAAAAVYSGVGLIIALAFTALWQYAIRGGRLLTPGFREREVADLSRQYRYGPLAYATAFAVSFVSAAASIGLCLAMVVFFAFLGLMGMGSR